MGMRKHNCRWCNAQKPSEPIRSAINHDAGITMFNKQRAMTPMSARAANNSAPGAKKRQDRRQRLHGRDASMFRKLGICFFSCGIFHLMAPDLPTRCLCGLISRPDDQDWNLPRCSDGRGDAWIEIASTQNY